MHDPASEVYAKAVIEALASVPGGVNNEAALRALVSLLVFTLSSKPGLTQAEIDQHADVIAARVRNETLPVAREMAPFTGGRMH